MNIEILKIKPQKNARTPRNPEKVQSPTSKNQFGISFQHYKAEIKKDSSNNAKLEEPSTVASKFTYTINRDLDHSTVQNVPEHNSDVLEHFTSSSSRFCSETSAQSLPLLSESPVSYTSEKRVTVYERSSMYDCSNYNFNEDSNDLNKISKGDIEIFQNSFHDRVQSDIDLRLPFQPVTNYIPATEIDASITSHSHLSYKVYECYVPRPKYTQLRHSFTCLQTDDPRLRRILGLPELLKCNTATAINQTIQKITSNSDKTSLPETEGASPSYYTPPAKSTMSNYAAVYSEIGKEDNAQGNTARLDPRRTASLSVTRTSSISESKKSTMTSGAQRQNIEIRNLLQKSDWYKNLNSKFKILVNQQLAVVSTELKKFHLDTSPIKVFDIQFIVGNPYLQQILTNLGIYIDDNGEVVYVENDSEQQIVRNRSNFPNLTKMPPNIQDQHHMEFFHGPNMPNVLQNIFPGAPTAHTGISSISGFTGTQNMQNVIVPNVRPGLINMLPSVSVRNVNPYNPFCNVNITNSTVLSNTNTFEPSADLITGYDNFNTVRPGMQNIQRKFNNPRHTRQLHNRQNSARK